MENKTVLVTNRSRATAVYSLEDPKVRRTFAPGQTLKIPLEELQALTYKPGGINLIQRCLLIKDESVLSEMPITVEPEYWLEEDGVIKLLNEGSVEELIDCLNFAPAGVIDLVKKYAIELPVNDARKRKQIKEKTGLDVDKALHNMYVMNEDDEDTKEKVQEKPERLTTPKTTGRVAATPNYKVVSDKGE